MLQHDIKFFEERNPSEDRPHFYAWCICGSCYANQNQINYEIMFQQFFYHLSTVNEFRMQARFNQYEGKPLTQLT